VKTIKMFNLYRGPPNPGPSEYEAGMVTTQQLQVHQFWHVFRPLSNGDTEMAVTIGVFSDVTSYNLVNRY
jgi:hypothetical protein